MDVDLPVDVAFKVCASTYKSALIQMTLRVANRTIQSIIPSADSATLWLHR